LKQQRFIRKKEKWGKGQWVFYLPKEQYQQRLYLLAVVDIQTSTTVPYKTTADSLEYKFSTHLSA
jgi:hypothetical protein